MSVTSPTLSLGSALPTGWSYYGCYTDYDRRKLAGPSYVASNMTQASCVSFCNTNNYPYAGVEYGQECYCGLKIGAGSDEKEDPECNFNCPGATDEACGAGNRLSVFYANALDYTVTNPGHNLTSRIGCVIDSVYDRVLSAFHASGDGMTVSQCTSSCKAAGYSVAGLEFGRECFCGDDIDVNATFTDEGCDMRCTGNSTEFCGGSARLEAYALNITVSSPENSTSTTPACTATASANAFAPNGGFQEGLADWLALAYNSSSSAFNIGITSDALSGCNALTVIPKPESKSLAQHFQISTTLTNLTPSSNYRLALSIGHPRVAGARNPIADPKYTVRLSNALLGYGAICGFAYAPCDLAGLNNSTYTTLTFPFTADNLNETLTVYLSWYNGNFDIPLYLDNVAVQPAEDNGSAPTTTLKLPPRELTSTTTTTSPTTTWSSPADPNEPDLPLTCPTPEDCPDGPAPLEITNLVLANSGFEADLDDWQFLPETGGFRITHTTASLEGDYAVSIVPNTATDEERSIRLVTTLSSLNASHEWYTVTVFIGHPPTLPLEDPTLAPWVSMKYINDITSDIQRRVTLCGATNAPNRFASSPDCEFYGREGSVWHEYGMDARSFLGADRIFTNATEMNIELEIVWPQGGEGVEVLVDRMRVWEIEQGTISR